jgi:hypothetical protein
MPPKIADTSHITVTELISFLEHYRGEEIVRFEGFRNEAKLRINEMYGQKAPVITFEEIP